MKLATKVRLAFVAKVTACLFAAFLFVSFTALFVVAPVHQHYIKHEQQKLMNDIKKTSQAIDQLNEVMIRINKTYRELHHP
jgi:uncharacterized membrane protein YbjE (DUF340 family)